MGTWLDIFRLYRVADGSTTRYILVKAIRPEFPNWSQPAGDAAIDEVERRLRTVVEKEVGPASAGTVEVVATWENGLPQGDCFYEETSGIDVAIWFALDVVHPGYFVFGVHPDEASFWNHVEELSRDSEICPITDYGRPATRVEVHFLQSQDFEWLRDNQPLQRTGPAVKRTWFERLFGRGPGR